MPGIEDFISEESEKYIQSIFAAKSKIKLQKWAADIAVTPFVPQTIELKTVKNWGRNPANWEKAPRNEVEGCLRILEAARDDYQEHGYARNIMQNQRGERCALGSIKYVLTTQAVIRELAGSTIDVLDHIAVQRYPFHHGQMKIGGIAGVNDHIGREAVLDCFDTAIKTLSALLEPQEPKDENW